MSHPLQAFDRSNTAHLTAAAAIWSAACGRNLAISPHFIEFNTRPSTGAMQAGQIALEQDQIVGFVLASTSAPFSEGAPRPGWIDAIAVRPESQRRGTGSTLLNWAEAWLREQGCTTARLGGSLRPFTAGLPAELQNDAFFLARGFEGSHRAWDVARDLSDYELTPVNMPDLITRPAQIKDEVSLREFFKREFPERWRYEFEEHLREGGRLSDYTILVSKRGVEGFCFLTFADSLRPLERFYMHSLARPWGQAGPLGVSADRRKFGFGRAVVDAGLRRLREAGVRGCVIDWTNLLDFYARFGFKPYREYIMLSKSL